MRIFVQELRLAYAKLAYAGATAGSAGADAGKGAVLSVWEQVITSPHVSGGTKTKKLSKKARERLRKEERAVREKAEKVGLAVAPVDAGDAPRNYPRARPDRIGGRCALRRQ